METIRARDAQLGDIISHQGEGVIIESIIPYGNRVRFKVIYLDDSVVNITMPTRQNIVLIDRA